ncbi:MAG: hypothetical protein JW915_10960 [Chitinispirillaceae bacterium]|nr:hypothetical protein [Chitinispirillaceae bacterium]
MKINHPNQIVDTLISDYRDAFGDILHSVIMYGSALSHEYVQGKSEVNLLVVLTDTSTEVLHKSIEVNKRWLKRGIVIPSFMTPHYIKSSLDSFPVEFVNIQCSYKVLYGDDLIRNLAINRESIRRQCERDLKEMIHYLKTEYLKVSGQKIHIKVLELSLERLFPLFRAILVLNDRKIPSSRSEIITSIEDIFCIGSSALSDVFLQKCKNISYEKSFDEFVKIVDMMVLYIDEMSVQEETM